MECPDRAGYERPLPHRRSAAGYNIHRRWCSVEHREIQNVETVTGPTFYTTAPRFHLP
jgi:hypothetical protein